VLRPPIAQERVTQGPDGLVRILLKHPFADGTVAIDLDPLSLLSRLAASVPAPGRHTVRYALSSLRKMRNYGRLCNCLQPLHIRRARPPLFAAR